MIKRHVRFKRLTSAFMMAAFVAVKASQPDALKLPFSETFAGTNLPPGWTEEVSDGTRLEFKQDGLHFNGPCHGTGHIEHRLGTDLVTVSARVAQWGSVYLIWDDHTWCAAGQISPTPFGRLYSTATSKGTPDEADHRGIDFGLARWVQIQLGENFVRFSYSNDGQQWLELRSIPRTKAFSGEPKWLAIGKYYEPEDNAFAPKTRKQTALETQGEKIGGRILEVKVEPISAELARMDRMSVRKLKEPRIDLVTAKFRQSKADPTFESIVGLYPPMKSPRELVGVPGHPLDIGVDRLGRFDVSPWSQTPVAWFELGKPGIPLGKEGVPLRRRLLKGYLPIDTLATSCDGVDCELSIFGWSEGFSVDQPLFAYAQLKMRANDGTKIPRDVALVAPGAKRISLHVTNRIGDGAGVCLHFKYPDPASATEIPPAEFENKKNEVAAHWEKKLAPAKHFDVPETRVMEAYGAWLTYSMLNADTINGFIEPHDGAGFYEEMFGNSVSVHTMALDAYGLHDYAARILDTQCHFQQTNGLYTQDCGLTDPGGFLCGLARHYRMTDDRAWLEKVRPHILKQCEWLMAQRANAPKSGITRGLIKFRPYNDYVAEVYNYLGNVWCAQGMAEVAAALETIRSPDAASIASESRKYRQDILDSMSSAAFNHDGQTLLPLEPDTRRLLKLERYRAAGYYSLSASPLLGIGFLSPDDKRTSWLVEALEKRGGLIAGVCEFETGIDHAYSYGYLLNELKRGEPRKTLLGFYSMLAFGMTRDTYSPVEVTMIETGENHYTLPHLYSCTEQLRLLRALLIREDGNELRLGEGIPHQWLESGKKVKVTSAPTEFGPVSYEIQAQGNGAFEVHLTPPQRRIPSKIVLVLRDPEGRRISSVDGPAGSKIKFSGENLSISKALESLILLVRF